MLKDNWPHPVADRWLPRRSARSVNSVGAEFIAKANAQTGASPEPQLTQKEFFYGSYVDEVVAYTVSYGATASRYYVSSNHLYSPAAITDSSGVVVERMKYDAYGRQTILPPGGTPPRSHSAVGFDRSFTGYIKDEETGLLHARARQYSPSLGRFVGRDGGVYSTLYMWGVFADMHDEYKDGYNLYQSYFIPGKLDSTGNSVHSPFDCECDPEFIEHGAQIRKVFSGPCDSLKNLRLVREWHEERTDHNGWQYIAVALKFKKEAHVVCNQSGCDVVGPVIVTETGSSDTLLGSGNVICTAYVRWTGISFCVKNSPCCLSSPSDSGVKVY